MQLEDEELGLGTSSAGHTPAVGDDLEPAPPVASTSRSPSPSRHKLPTAKDAAALAESLADLDLSTNGADRGGDGARSDDDNHDEVDWTAPTAASTKKSKKKQRKKAQIVPGFDDNDDDDEVLGDSGPVSDVDLTDVIGMAPSGGRRKNKKGKGRQGARVASGAAAEGDDDVAGAASVPDRAGAEDEEARSAPVKKGISRSRARSPTLPPPGADLEEGDGREPSLGVDGSDADEAKSSTQLSKKEKRRLKEAAKKATANGGGGGATEVVVRALSYSVFDLAPGFSFADLVFLFFYCALISGDGQKCNVCSESFPSRSKLFQHINDTGHALADGAAGGQMNAGGGGPRRKKGKR